MKGRDLAALMALLGTGAYALRDKTELDVSEPFRSMSREEVNRSLKTGGKVGSASKRADGIAKRGKTRGKMV